MILAGLFTLLSNSSALTTLVGSGIYPVELPESSALPALTYKVIATSPRQTLTTSGMQRWRIQFDCWGKAYADAVSVREALRQALEGYRGALSDGTYLQDAQVIQMIDDFDHEALQFRVMVEFYLFFNFSS